MTRIWPLTSTEVPENRSEIAYVEPSARMTWSLLAPERSLASCRVTVGVVGTAAPKAARKEQRAKIVDFILMFCLKVEGW